MTSAVDNTLIMYHDCFMEQRGVNVRDTDAILGDVNKKIAEAQSGALLTRRILESSVPIEANGSMSPHEAKLRADLASLEESRERAVKYMPLIPEALSEAIATTKQQLEQYDQKTEANPSETRELAVAFGLEDENDPEVAKVLAELGEQEQKAIAAVVSSLRHFDNHYRVFNSPAVINNCREQLIRRLTEHFFQVAQERQIKDNLARISVSPAEAVRVSKSLLGLLKDDILQEAQVVANGVYQIDITDLSNDSLRYDGLVAYILIGGSHKFVSSERIMAKAYRRQEKKMLNQYGHVTHTVTHNESEYNGDCFIYTQSFLDRYPAFVRELALVQEAQRRCRLTTLLLNGLQFPYRLSQDDEADVAEIVSTLETFQPVWQRELKALKENTAKVKDLIKRVEALPGQYEEEAETRRALEPLKQRLWKLEESKRRLENRLPYIKPSFINFQDKKRVKEIEQQLAKLHIDYVLLSEEIEVAEKRLADIPSMLRQQLRTLAEEAAPLLGMSSNDHRLNVRDREELLRMLQERMHHFTTQLNKLDCRFGSTEEPAALPSGTDETYSRALSSGQL